MLIDRVGQHGLEGEPVWVRAHEALSRLSRARATADAEEGRWLLAALRSAAHVHLGFGSFGEYIERLFGYRPRSTQEKLRVAEALEGLPRIADALEHGDLNWSIARELTRVAVAETESEWLEVARGKTAHQIEALVAGKLPGDSPSASNSSAARRHVLRFEVMTETLALFREAINRLRRGSGASFDDDDALMLMARHVLGGPRDTGRASYQIVLSVCPHCRAGAQQANGELLAVDADVVAMADCDGQHLDLVPAAADARATPTATATATATATVRRGPPKFRRLTTRHPSATPTRARRSRTRPLRTNDEAPETGIAIDFEHTHARAPIARRLGARPLARATQTIPPATRRAVLRRDHDRCTVPGCRNALYLDLHHIDLRSEGGPHDPDNLTTLCGAHHRAVHRGQLAVTGSVSTGIRFARADGTAYGGAPNARADRGAHESDVRRPMPTSNGRGRHRHHMLARLNWLS